MKLFARLLALVCLLLLANFFKVHAQNVGIGTTSPTQTLDVNGTVRVRGLTGTGTRLLQTDDSGNLSSAAALYPTDGVAAAPLSSTIAGLNNPLVAVSGTLAVVLNRGASSLSFYDLSTPGAPVLRGTYTDATNLANAQEVALNGTVAAVLCNTATANGTGLTQVFALGSGAPVLASTLPAPAALSASYGGIALVGSRLYAIYDRGGSYGYFYVYDVSTPTAPTLLNPGTPCGTCTTGNTGSFSPQTVAAAGTLAAVGNAYAGVTVLDVSDPTAIKTVGGTGNPGYNGADQPVAMTTSTLCTLTIPSNQLATYSLSATGVPTLRSTFTTATTPVSVALSGSLAYVACRASGANVLQIIDVSGSTAVLRGTVALDATNGSSSTAGNVATTGNLTAVANGAAANDLQVFSTGRVLTVAPDGSLSSAPAPSGSAFIQNQTATVQAGGFNIGGSAVVGGTLAVGVLNNFAGGAAGAPLALSTKAASYLSLRPTTAGTDDYFQLPAASTCAGRLYYLCNVGSVPANVTSAGGSLVRASTGAASSPFAMPTGSLGRTVIAISDGVNWNIGTIN